MEENIKILIIEDNVERASELQKYLNKAGFYNIRHYKDFQRARIPSYMKNLTLLLLMSRTILLGVIRMPV